MTDSTETKAVINAALSAEMMKEVMKVLAEGQSQSIFTVSNRFDPEFTTYVDTGVAGSNIVGPYDPKITVFPNTAPVWQAVSVTVPSIPETPEEELLAEEPPRRFSWKLYIDEAGEMALDFSLAGRKVTMRGKELNAFIASMSRLTDKVADEVEEKLTGDK